MSNQLATKDNASLSALLRTPAYQNRFQEVLGKRAGQFISSIISVGNTMPDADPVSIISAAMTAAALNLPVERNLGFAWIVPYKTGGRTICQFQCGYKGYIQLAQRTGMYQRLNARAVNKEAFSGYDDVGEPIIKWDEIDDAKETVGYVFAWKLVNGFTKVCYWTKQRIIEHAKRYSKAYNSASSPWQSHFDAMAIKTVIKAELSKWGVLSTELQEAIQKDQGTFDGEALAFEDLPEKEPVKPTKPPLKSAKPAEPTPPAATAPAQDPPPPPPQPNEGPNKKGPPTPAKEPEPEDNLPEDPPPPLAQPAEAPVETPASEPPADPQTPQQIMDGFLEKNGIEFDAFKTWLGNSGRYRDASAMATIADCPTEVLAKLDEASLNKLIRIYGKK